MKIDLDAPAFGNGSPKVEVEEAKSTDKFTADAPQAKSEEEEKVTSGTEKPVVEEQSVPYSRFSTVHKRAIDAEREADESKRRYDDLLNSRATTVQPTQEVTEVYKGLLPSYWLKLYGDSDESREAYTYELQRQNEIVERAERQALETVSRQRQEETETVRANENLIDDRLLELGTVLGRDLTPEEEDSILGIVDEYTPKDEEGNYAGDTIPFDKAWEIHELKQSTQGTQRRGARKAATAATSVRSEGETDTDRKKNDDGWRPNDWGSYQRRF